MSLTDTKRGELIRDRINANRKFREILLESLDRSREFLSKDNPFLLSLGSLKGGSSEEATIKMTYEDEAYLKKATVAERFDNKWIFKFYNLLTLGTLLRANEYELEQMERRGEDNKEAKDILLKEQKFAEELLKERAEELEKILTIQLSQ